METLSKRIEKKNFGTAYRKLNDVALETKSSFFNNCIHNPARPRNHNQINVFNAWFFFWHSRDTLKINFKGHGSFLLVNVFRAYCSKYKYFNIDIVKYSFLRLRAIP